MLSVTERGTEAGSALRRIMQIPSRSFRCEQRTGDFVIESISELSANLGGTTDYSIRPNGMDAFLFS